MKRVLKRIGIFLLSHLTIVIIMAFAAVFAATSFLASMNSVDGRLRSADRLFRTPEISKAMTDIEAAPSRSPEICSALLSSLRKNYVYESKFTAMLLCDRAAEIMDRRPGDAKKIISESFKFSSKYKRAHFYLLILRLYDLDLWASASELSSITYLEFLSPETILYTMKVALVLFLSFIFMQFVFFGSIYTKYRRLLKHEAAELDIDVSTLSVAPYLNSTEKKYMSYLTRSVIISVILIIFYCYFSTGFGRALGFVSESLTYLKNPLEYCTINGLAYSPRSLVEFPDTVRSVLAEKSYSYDFYAYIACLSRLAINDGEGAMKYFARIPSYSFLKSRVPAPNSTIRFIEDDDLYFAFFSPSRSNPLFMIAVLVNVLLILVFFGIIKKAHVLTERDPAALCSCGGISCAGCRTAVGLCNACLAPVSPSENHRNAVPAFYDYDRRALILLSFFFPGFIFFYVGKNLHGAFYSLVLSLLGMTFAINAIGLVDFGVAATALLFCVPYALYLFEVFAADGSHRSAPPAAGLSENT